MVTCKRIKLPNKEEEFFKVLPKMNEIVDLTEDKPYIIIDLSYKRKRIITRKHMTKTINKKIKRVTIVSGPLPLRLLKKCNFSTGWLKAF
jgi:hypothetical protein